VRFTLQAAAAPDGGGAHGGLGGVHALRAQEFILHVCAQHLTNVGRGLDSGESSPMYSSPLQPQNAGAPQPLLLRVQSLNY